MMYLSHGIVMMTQQSEDAVFYQSNRALRDESSLYSNLLVLEVIVGVISY